MSEPERQRDRTPWWFWVILIPLVLAGGYGCELLRFWLYEWWGS